MLIIEGRHGKARKLEEILNQIIKEHILDENKSIYMFDAVKINLEMEKVIHYCHLGKDYNILLDWSKISLSKYIDNGIIVFEYNVPFEIKDKFIEMAKFWENESYIDEVIMTIQNNNLDEIKVYEI